MTSGVSWTPISTNFGAADSLMTQGLKLMSEVGNEADRAQRLLLDREKLRSDELRNEQDLAFKYLNLASEEERSKLSNQIALTNAQAQKEMATSLVELRKHQVQEDEDQKRSNQIYANVSSKADAKAQEALAARNEYVRRANELQLSQLNPNSDEYKQKAQEVLQYKALYDGLKNEALSYTATLNAGITQAIQETGKSPVINPVTQKIFDTIQADTKAENDARRKTETEIATERRSIKNQGFMHQLFTPIRDALNNDGILENGSRNERDIVEFSTVIDPFISALIDQGKSTAEIRSLVGYIATVTRNLFNIISSKIDNQEAAKLANEILANPNLQALILSGKKA